MEKRGAGRPVAPCGIDCTNYRIRRCDRSHQAGELRDTDMSRLRRAADMCSSTESGTAQR